MAKTLQFRRDTTANLASVTGAAGEIFYDTTKDTLVVMDGSTPGGYPLEKEGAGTGATGAAGATGSAGTNGATGVTGATGVAGNPGSNGTNGTDGATGSQGIQGASGSTGLTGATGSQGIQGSSGVQGATGIQGEQGNFGGAAFEYVYDSSSTADSDPGTGRVKFSNTTFSSASFMYINETDFNSLTATSFLETIDDSTSNIKGHFSIADKTDPLVYSLFTITGAHTKSGSYYKIPVGYVSGDTTITDETNTVVTFQRTGDKGDTGQTGATGASGINGATGAIGSTGPAGTDGATGAAGTNGTNGATGPAGTNGTNGASGAAGSAGAQGASGATGTAGSNGTDGATGPQGASGVGSSLGATSSVSIANLQVGTGATGATGSINASTYIRVGFAPGATGFVGATGSLSAVDAYFSSVRVNGATLTSGATGVAGSAGAAGATGPQGNNGNTGATGVAGPTSGYLNGPITGFSLLIGATGVLTSGATGQGWFGSALYVGSQGATGIAWGASGTIRATGDITAFYSSDRTLKENIQDIPGALDKVVAIGGKTFDWTDEYIAEHGGADGYFVNKADFGVIAQDVQDVFPVAVRLRDNGKLAVDYDKLVALAFAAIKELKAQLDAK